MITTTTNNTINLNNYSEYDIINFAINLHNTLSQIPLPPHCTLNPRQRNNDSSVIIEFTQPDSHHRGNVMMYKSNNQDNNNPNAIEMMCSINGFNGYYLDITVYNIEEVIEVISFSQQLLQYQPNVNVLNYIYVPPHLLNHWCILPYLRSVNLEMQNNFPRVMF